MTSAVLRLTAFFLLFSSITRAEGNLEAQVDAYLASLDGSVRVEQWRALGVSALPILEKRALSAEVLPTTRARAAEALGLVGSSTHAQKLLALASSEKDPLVVRLSALRAAGQLHEESTLAEALTPLLTKDASPRMRATAADVLTQRLGTTGCELVKSRMKTEPGRNQRLYSPALERCRSTDTSPRTR
jgi:HEAT repeat protein